MLSMIVKILVSVCWKIYGSFDWLGIVLGYVWLGCDFLEMLLWAVAFEKAAVGVLFLFG